jgi:hypothetical protein
MNISRCNQPTVDHCRPFLPEALRARPRDRYRDQGGTAAIAGLCDQYSVGVELRIGNPQVGEPRIRRYEGAQSVCALVHIARLLTT